MGCLEETCRLTNTAISVGESCVIIINRDRGQDPYEIKGRVYMQYEESVRELSDIEKTAQNIGIETQKDHDLWAYFTPILHVVHGTYNDYGAIEEDERLPYNYDELYDNANFFHRWAIEAALKGKIEDLIKEPIKLANDLYIYMYNIRRNPNIKLPAFQFHYDGEYEKIIALNEATNEYLKRKMYKIKTR